MDGLKFVICTITAYSVEVAQLAAFIRQFTPASGVRFLDVGDHSVKLCEEVDNADDQTVFFHVLGHDYLTHEGAVCQLNDARIGHGGELSDKSIFLFTKDCFEGLQDIRLNSGRQIINDIWENRILSIEHSTLTTKSTMLADSPFTPVTLGEAIAIRDKWKNIKSGLFFLVDFLLGHSSAESFDVFIRENNLVFI
jgi:hypothetical protein